MEHEGLKTHKALPISVFNYFIISAKNYGESAIYASELEKLFEGDSKQRAINYWCIAGGVFFIILPEAHISYLDAYSARQKPQTTKEYIHSFWKVIVAVTYALPVIDSLNELNGFKWEDDGYLDTRASWGFSITMGFLSCIYYYIALSSAKLNETLCSKFWLTFTNIIATVFCAEIYLTYNSMRSIIVSATHGEEHY